MNEQPHDQNVSAPQPAESEVVALIKKMHQQLIFLEKKIDMLISQSGSSQERPSRPFSSRPPYRGNYNDKRGLGGDSRERSFRSDRPFDKHKSYNRDAREGGSGQDRPFQKKYDGGKKGFVPKKKSFYQGYAHKPESR